MDLLHRVAGGDACIRGPCAPLTTRLTLSVQGQPELATWHFRFLVLNSQALAQRLAARISSGTDQPISSLIVDDIWLAVVEGSLRSGERLPTARQVAVALGVSPKIVEQAFVELETRGVLATRPGEGTCISLAPPSQEDLERHRRFADLCRSAYERSRELGFTVNDLIDALAEFRTLERNSATEESQT